jgi:hypothetical protein
VFFDRFSTKIAMIDKNFPPYYLKRNALDFVAQISSDMENSGLPNCPSIIIGGAQRCGKSIVAKWISEDLQMFHLKSDYVRDSLYGELKGKQKRWSASYVFKRILNQFPQGVLAEGTVFTDNAKSVPIWANKNERNIQVYIIGSASDFRKKYEAMSSFRKNSPCWTSKKLDESQLLNLAKHITEKSAANKELCLKYGFTYFDIDPLNFSRDLTKVVTKIKNNILFT